MALKFSQLPNLASLQLTAGLVTNYNGVNYLLTLATLQGLITKSSLGLSNVDNTSDAGKPISDLTVAALANKAALAHTHLPTEIVGLDAILLQYAPVNHVHAIAAVTGLQAALDLKLNAADSLPIANVTGLQTALAGKAALVHAHNVNDITGLPESLQSILTLVNGKANTVHLHVAADVTDFQPTVVSILNSMGVVESPVAVGALAW